MIFWSYMVLIDLLIPATMVIVGLIFRKHPPRSVNGIFGYRTRRSMKSQEAWDFANGYMGKIWFHWGLILLPLSVVPMLFVIGGDTDRINAMTITVCLLQLIPVLLSNLITEKALKDRFDADGKRKED